MLVMRAYKMDSAGDTFNLMIQDGSLSAHLGDFSSRSLRGFIKFLRTTREKYRTNLFRANEIESWCDVLLTGPEDALNNLNTNMPYLLVFERGPFDVEFPCDSDTMNRMAAQIEQDMKDGLVGGI